MPIDIPKTERRRLYFGHDKRNPIIEPKPFNHTHSLTGAEFKTYKTSCVYAWKRGEEWLYVGHSSRGLQRIMDSKHHAMHQAEMQDDDKILIMYNLSIMEARLTEVDMIRRYRPKYNKITP